MQIYTFIAFYREYIEIGNFLLATNSVFCIREKAHGGIWYILYTRFNK